MKLKRMKLKRNINMTAFRKKYLATPPKRVCLRLKELRQKHGLSLNELSKQTKISKKYLQAMEDWHFKDLQMATIYQKNFVRKYVEALGAEPEPFIKQYLIEEMLESKKGKHPHKTIKFNPLNFLPSIIRYSLIIIIALILIGYLGWQVKQIIEPPNLLVYHPPEGYITENKQLVIIGETNHETILTINGQEIAHDETGNFKETIDLTTGVNTIIVIAQKKHGKTTTEIRHVVLREGI